LRRAGRRAILSGVRNAELLPVFCIAIAVELAHLRYVILNRWHCRSCGETHLECGCKPSWVRLLL